MERGEKREGDGEGRGSEEIPEEDQGECLVLQSHRRGRGGESRAEQRGERQREE